MVHLPDLLFGNFPGKVKDSSFASAAPVTKSGLEKSTELKSRLVTSIIFFEAIHRAL